MTSDPNELDLDDKSDDELTAEIAAIGERIAPHEARLTSIRAEVRRRVVAAMTDEEKHQNECHPDWEYQVTTVARKTGNAMTPEGDGWEPNDCIECHVYSDGQIVERRWQSWERFDHHEEEHWRRRRTASSSAPTDDTAPGKANLPPH